MSISQVHYCTSGG